MSSTRCEICGQAATHKCTDCGEVFCDLHVRLAGSEGSMVGYFCDECWEKRRQRRGRSMWIVLMVAVFLLAANVAGLFFLKSGTEAVSASEGPVLTSIAAIIVGVLVLILLILAAKNRARKH